MRRGARGAATGSRRWRPSGSPTRRQFGVAITDEDGRIQGFQEKPDPAEALSDLANCGIYMFRAEIFDYFPRPGHRSPAGDDDQPEGFVDWAMDVFPALLENDVPFHSHEIDAYWNDIGSIGEYVQGNFDALAGEIVDRGPRGGRRRRLRRRGLGPRRGQGEAAGADRRRRRDRSRRRPARAGRGRRRGAGSAPGRWCATRWCCPGPCSRPATMVVGRRRRHRGRPPPWAERAPAPIPTRKREPARHSRARRASPRAARQRPADLLQPRPRRRAARAAAMAAGRGVRSAPRCSEELAFASPPSSSGAARASSSRSRPASTRGACRDLAHGLKFGRRLGSRRRRRGGDRRGLPARACSTGRSSRCRRRLGAGAGGASIPPRRSRWRWPSDRAALRAAACGDAGPAPGRQAACEPPRRPAAGDGRGAESQRRAAGRRRPHHRRDAGRLRRGAALGRLRAVVALTLARSR